MSDRTVSKEWKLRCGHFLRVNDFKDRKGLFSIQWGKHESGVLTRTIYVDRYKSTITAIRRMCDWMEERL